MAKYFLAVDGGGTKTDVVCANENGDVIGRGVSGPTNITTTSVGAASFNLIEAIRQSIESLPIEAREVRCQWIIGGVFYLIDFVVGEGEPYADFDFEIPGERGGTHKTRFYGQLEGVTEEAKSLAWQAQKLSGISMHDWLDELIKKEAIEIIKNNQ